MAPSICGNASATPRALALICAAHGELQVLPLPLPMVVSVCQTWHERVHKDPAHVWFRQSVFATFHADGTVGAEANALESAVRPQSNSNALR